MIQISASLEGTNGCCGVIQITGFSDGFSRWATIKATGNTEEEACKNLFDQFNTIAGVNSNRDEDDDEWCASVFQIWFVKKTNYEGEYGEHYEREPLRKLVEAIPGVINLGEYRNPNTGNMIQGYQWEIK